MAAATMQYQEAAGIKRPPASRGRRHQEAADLVSGATAALRRLCGITDTNHALGMPVHDQNKLSGIQLELHESSNHVV